MTLTKEIAQAENPQDFEDAVVNDLSNALDGHRGQFVILTTQSAFAKHVKYNSGKLQKSRRATKQLDDFLLFVPQSQAAKSDQEIDD